MDTDTLKTILGQHKLWLSDEPGGERAELPGADLSWANLAKADLAKADLSGACLSNTDLRGAVLSGAVLSGAVLTEADLRSADLSAADMSGAVVVSANLTRAYLTEANLAGAKCGLANFGGAMMRGSDLRRADLEEADFRDADLRGAMLDGATLDGARFEGSMGADVTRSGSSRLASNNVEPEPEPQDDIMAGFFEKLSNVAAVKWAGSVVDDLNDGQDPRALIEHLSMGNLKILCLKMHDRIRGMSPRDEGNGVPDKLARHSMRMLRRENDGLRCKLDRQHEHTDAMYVRTGELVSAVVSGLVRLSQLEDQDSRFQDSKLRIALERGISTDVSFLRDEASIQGFIDGATSGYEHMLQSVYDSVAKTIVEPVCDQEGLEFTAGNGVWFFRTKDGETFGTESEARDRGFESEAIIEAIKVLSICIDDLHGYMLGSQVSNVRRRGL